MGFRLEGSYMVSACGPLPSLKGSAVWALGFGVYKAYVRGPLLRALFNRPCNYPKNPLPPPPPPSRPPSPVPPPCRWRASSAFASGILFGAVRDRMPK